MAQRGLVEGTWIELKRQWPKDAPAFAKRVAAMCNAARGGRVLVLVGLDEDTFDVVGCDAVDLAEAWPVVEKSFDGLAPSFVSTLVPCDGKNVLALCFDTDRVPYVWRGPDGVCMTPWRSATKTRGARRDELLRLLDLSEGAATFDVEHATLDLIRDRRGTVWQLAIKAYVVPKRRTFWIPRHYCHAYVELGDGPSRFEMEHVLPTLKASDQSTAITEICIDRPTFVDLVAELPTVVDETALERWTRA